MTTIHRFDYALTADNDDAIAESQTPAAGGVQALTLDGSAVSGGVATLDVQRRVLITCAGSDAGRTFTITGTDDAGYPISEDVAGANADTSSSTLDFKTVTSVTVDDDTDDAVEIGTSAVGASRMRVMNLYQEPFNVSLGTTVSGTVNYTIQYSLDDPFGDRNAMTWFAVTALTGKTDAQISNFSYPVTAVRTLINSGTGTVRLRVLQGG